MCICVWSRTVATAAGTAASAEFMLEIQTRGSMLRHHVVACQFVDASGLASGNRSGRSGRSRFHQERLEIFVCAANHHAIALLELAALVPV